MGVFLLSLFSKVSPNNSNGVLIIELSLSKLSFIFEIYAINSSFDEFKFISVLNILFFLNFNWGLLKLKRIEDIKFLSIFFSSIFSTIVFLSSKLSLKKLSFSK